MADLSVSVALATCNGAEHLREQLADLSGQSCRPAELVVCDDASTDETLSVIEEFAASAPFPVHTRRNPVRLGYRENFIRCAARCSSDLIAFCDQDDRWPTQKLRIATECFDDPDVLLVFHNARVVSDLGHPIGTLYPTSMRPRRWTPLSGAPWSFSPGFSQVFLRSLLEFDDLWEASQDENAEGEKLPHDRWYFFLASVLGSVRYLPDCLADYRQHGQNSYGWRQFAPSFKARLVDRVNDPGRAIARRSRAAESRAAVLDQVAERVTGPAKGRALAGADAYRKLAERSALRAKIYESRTLAERSRTLLNLIRSGAYGSNSWQFGPLGLAMDGLIGVTGIHRQSDKSITAGSDHDSAGNMA